MSSLLRAVSRALPTPVRDALRRALYPLLNGGFFTTYIITKDMEGETFQFLIGDRTGRAWYDRPCINNPRWLELRFIKEHMIAHGDVVLECGGHHGCSAILLSRWVGATGKIVTFEPFAGNADILERNLKLNGIGNVVLERRAVGATRGEIVIEAAASAVNTSGNGVSVPLITLDEYAHHTPTFIKIDVEGFELQVLQGARGILKQRPKLAIEIHPDLLAQYGGSVRELLDLLQLDRYSVWIQWKDDEQPVRYDCATPITQRAHLFCLPLH